MTEPSNAGPAQRVSGVIVTDEFGVALELARQSLFPSQQGRLAIVDLDGTLVDVGGGKDPAQYQAASSLLRSAVLQGLRILVVTNRRQMPLDLPELDVLCGAHKPWTRLSVIRRYGQPVCVIGDQLFTDGGLALRLRVPLLRVPARGPLRPWRSRVVERALEPLVRWLGWM